MRVARPVWFGQISWTTHYKYIYDAVGWGYCEGRRAALLFVKEDWRATDYGITRGLLPVGFVSVMSCSPMLSECWNHVHSVCT